MEEKKLNHQTNSTNTELPDDALENAVGGARSASSYQAMSFYTCKNCNKGGAMNSKRLEMNNWRCLNCGAYIDH